MEKSNINNPDSKNKETRVIPGSEEWLGGEEIEEASILDDSSGEGVVEVLPSGIGLDGDEYTEVIPSKNLSVEEEVIEEAIIIPEHLVEASKTALSFLTDAISQGAREGWDTKNDKPDGNFIEKQGAEIEKIVKALATGWREDCVVYDLLKSESMPMLNNRERAVRDGLLKRASHSCLR